MTLGLRALAIVLAAILFSLGSATTALAFTAQSGFSATTYATLPSGAAAGVAFVGPVMYVVEPAGGGLYRVAIAGSVALVATVPGGPTGLASFGGSLYATRHATNDVVRIDPLSGTVTPIAASADFADLQVNAIAADASNGDLYVTTAFGYVWVIHTPLTPTSPAPFFHLPADAPTYGIAVAADHSLYVAVPSGPANGIWQIAGGAPGLIGVPFSGARGVGVIPGYVFVNNADGSITKLIIPGVGTGSAATALTGGAAGDLAAIGTDGCFYASQGATVVRVASTDGGCNLANAAPPPPPPALTLVRTSTNLPLIGNGDQTFSATLANVTVAANVAVTFTVVRGATTTTTVATTGPNGVASFGYTATSPGTDVIAASAVVNGSTITSNSISVIWPRPLDTAAPTITYTVTGTHNTPGPNGSVFSCPNPTLGQLGSTEYCGWYTSPPTVHFTVTANGPSRLTPYSCPDFTLMVNSPITGTPVTCTASNGDGVAAALRVVLQALITAPTIRATASTPTGPYTGGPTSQHVTVTFVCGSDPDLGPAAISFCTTPVTVSAEGLTVVPGYVLDVAGTRVSASFGPIFIDTSAPVITATMKTATDRLPYTSGTPTVQDVIVTFSCTDTFDPHPTCPAPVTVSSGSSITVSAADWVGNSKSYTFGGIVIDRTGPTVSAVVTPAPDVNGNNALTATASVTATDASGIASITYSATGAQTIGSTTVLATGGPTTFTVPVRLTAIGTTTVSYSARDALGNVSLTGTTIVKILATQPTTLSITSAPSLAQDVRTVSAALFASGVTPVAGQTVTFTAGTTSVSGLTGANGVATATLALAPGTYSLTVAFAGTSAYLPSNAGPQALFVYGATQFVIWGGNAGGVQVGQRVVFWGEKWWDQVNLPERSRVKDFKGWADTVNGTTWTTKSGNSKPPEVIPTYVSVIITTSIDRVDDKGDKAKIRGNIVRHAILRVDSPYKDEPGKPVYGVVVALLP